MVVSAFGALREAVCQIKQSSPRLIIGELLIATNTLSVNSQFSKGVTISNALCLESRGMHPPKLPLQS
ncbi:MAG: hypothetical protein IJS05_06235 [Paludibacteraceae bacterium]|nr:hypothetical protein [Paludibacteraceae bacterium]